MSVLVFVFLFFIVRYQDRFRVSKSHLLFDQTLMSVAANYFASENKLNKETTFLHPTKSFILLYDSIACR